MSIAKKPFFFKSKFRGGGMLAANKVLLDDKGIPQMYMGGDQLVFSRKSSKKFIDLALKASESGSPEALMALGKAVYDERMAQIKRTAKATEEGS